MEWNEVEGQREREGESRERGKGDYIAVILNINFGKEFKDYCFNTFTGMRLGEASMRNPTIANNTREGT